MSDLSRTIHNPPTTDGARAIAAAIGADATASALLPPAAVSASATTAAYAASPSEAGELGEVLAQVNGGVLLAITRTVAFDDANILTGVDLYTPGAYDVLLVEEEHPLADFSIGTVWNGTTPNGHFGRKDIVDTGPFDITAPDGNDGFFAGGMANGSFFPTPNPASLLRKLVASPQFWVDDGASGDPGSTQGEITIRFLIYRLA